MTGGWPRWRRAPRAPEEVPEIPLEEVQRRVDGREGIAPREPPRSPWIGGQDDLPAGPERSVTPAAVSRAEPIPDPRRLLWRDSATILVFVVIALLVAQALPTGGVAVPDPSAIPSGVLVGSIPPGFSPPPGGSSGPIVDPSIGIDARPTAIPAMTQPPTRGSKATPKPTPAKTPTPPKTPPPTPPPTPENTPAPPTASFSWSQSAPFIIDFTNLSTGDVSWLWEFGDGTTSTEQSPTHTFPVTVDPTDYQVRLTVSGPGGSDSVQRTVTVSPV